MICLLFRWKTISNFIRNGIYLNLCSTEDWMYNYFKLPDHWIMLFAELQVIPVLNECWEEIRSMIFIWKLLRLYVWKLDQTYSAESVPVFEMSGSRTFSAFVHTTNTVESLKLIEQVIMHIQSFEYSFYNIIFFLRHFDFYWNILCFNYYINIMNDFFLLRSLHIHILYSLCDLR